jgi:hypothetical protein
MLGLPTWLAIGVPVARLFGAMVSLSGTDQELMED